MLSSLNSRRILLVGVISVLLVFQNCAPAPEQSDLLDSKSSYTENLPFAYDSKIDTLAYMSCSDMANGSYQPRSYFTFRAGSYSSKYTSSGQYNSAKGGISITNDFRTKTQYYSNTDRGQALSASAENANAYLNLSIRQSSNLRSIYQADATASGYDIDTFLPPLDSAELAGQIGSIPQGQYVNYFSGTNDKRLMEASLRFTRYENVAEENRANFNAGSSMLVMGYSQTADAMDTQLRAPATATGTNANRYAYGTGYKLNFTWPSRMTSSQKNRVISPNVGIQEYDLATGSLKSNGAFDCSANYQFMVVRPEDIAAGRVACRVGADRINTQFPAQPAMLDAIRRVLRVEDWFVDLDNQCVVPKRTGDLCYGSNLGSRTIVYNGATCADDNLYRCPHFVSVCIRKAP